MAIMANPRKFSEKIALHTHRQAEETAAFEKIMKEVSDVKVASPHLDRVSQSKNTLRISPAQNQSLGAFRGGSLPDVSAPRPPDKRASTTAARPSDKINKPNEESPQTRMINQTTRQSRTRSPVGPIRSTRDRKPSPYSSGPYLSLPSDTGWRRTNSDSALHQSAMQGMGMERNDAAQRVSWGMLPSMMNGPERGQDGRPRSSCDLPRAPGIHIYPSTHDLGIVQVPIGNNTGSLPDLTNMDFTSPIHAPLDQDQDSSPYSSSPINTSPSTLSPTSMMTGVRAHTRFNFPHGGCESQPLSSDKNIGLESDFSQLGALTEIYNQTGSPSSPVLTQIDGYRSPRPSPQPSPTLGGRHSAPCSPGEPNSLPNDYHLQNQNIQFQQHFEQLTVSDSPIGQIPYGDQTSNAQMMQSHAQNAETGYFPTSPSQQLVFPSPSPGLQNTSPNTPTSLPEIILTDCSANQDLRRQLDSDFLTDELKEDLGVLNFDELQMLNSIGVSDIVEDFRS
ncbi:CREB-regulated transcription coactivator isoform X2 [Rhynchophorus ferrugineus]|uniref:CREB-regulated transcription coactivator isoform X2 n=1 Tax=Rhynchophorus ferrugineus TaxID=354439 RepID=UPI003FCCE77D